MHEFKNSCKFCFWIDLGVTECYFRWSINLFLVFMLQVWSIRRTFLDQLITLNFRSCSCKTSLQLRFVFKNKDFKSKVGRINLKWILLNHFKWILHKLFRILHGQYRPMQLYLKASFSLPAQASFFLICAGYSADLNYRPHLMPRPGKRLCCFSIFFAGANFHFADTNSEKQRQKIWIVRVAIVYTMLI